MGKYTIALDQGTSSSRAIVYDPLFMRLIIKGGGTTLRWQPVIRSTTA